MNPKATDSRVLALFIMIRRLLKKRKREDGKEGTTSDHAKQRRRVSESGEPATEGAPGKNDELENGKELEGEKEKKERDAMDVDAAEQGLHEESVNLKAEHPEQDDEKYTEKEINEVQAVDSYYDGEASEDWEEQGPPLIFA